MRVHHYPLNMVDQRGCWYPISIFGKAPSGCVVCTLLPTTSLDSGKCMVTTIMATHGKNNATTAIRQALTTRRHCQLIEKDDQQRIIKKGEPYANHRQ
jgi:hypothetical protein